MKQSTIGLINQAMFFNVQIQEDNLVLQDVCSNLCKLSRDIDKNIDLKSNIDKVESLENFAQNLGLESYTIQMSSDLKSDVCNQIDNLNSKMFSNLNRQLLAMLECSIADLNRVKSYPIVKDMQPINSIMYHYTAYENLTTSLAEMLTSICKLGCEDLSYDQLKDQFLKDNELGICVTGLTLNDKDYASMTLPSPKYQSTKDAEITDNTINNATKLVNGISSSENLKKLADIKYGIIKRMEQHGREDAIKAIHFIAQIVTSIKNSVLLMQNYHEALINDL